MDVTTSESAGAESQDTLPAPVKAVLLITIGGMVVGFAYWADKLYGRWLRENHPLAAPKARISRAKSTYRRKRASATEWGGFIGEVLDEVARAIAD